MTLDGTMGEPVLQEERWGNSAETWAGSEEAWGKNVQW